MMGLSPSLASWNSRFIVPFMDIMKRKKTPADAAGTFTPASVLEEYSENCLLSSSGNGFQLSTPNLQPSNLWRRAHMMDNWPRTFCFGCASTGGNSLPGRHTVLLSLPRAGRNGKE